MEHSKCSVSQQTIKRPGHHWRNLIVNIMSFSIQMTKLLGCSGGSNIAQPTHDHVIKWKHFPRYCHLCGEVTSPGEFPAQRPLTRSFCVFFDLCLIKRLSKHSRGWWFETLSRLLWRHCNVDTPLKFIWCNSSFISGITSFFINPNIGEPWNRRILNNNISPNICYTTVKYKYDSNNLRVTFAR